MKKKKLDTNELMDHMKAKGITFKNPKEKTVKKYITDSTYYFKIASYRKNFSKNKNDEYIDLDFSHLILLSKIDHKLRELILTMCLDIEHSLKTKMVKNVSENTDGYEPVREYFKINKKAKNQIKNNDRESSYSHHIIEKYHPNYPIWVFVEIISFGTLTSFISFYETNYHYKLISNKVLNNVRDLRNAAAHNTCTLVDFVTTKQLVPDEIICSFVSSMGIGKSSRSNNLSNKFVYDFVCLLYTHKTIVNDSKKLSPLKNYIKVLSKKENDFKNNKSIIRVYNFIKKIIDKL